VGKELFLSYINAMIELWKGKKLERYWDYLKAHGVYFKGATHSREHIRVLPRLAVLRTTLRPKVKECYYNAQLATVFGPGFIRPEVEYYEGLAISFPDLPPVAHAWNLIEGKVLNFTWEHLPRYVPEAKLEDFQYFGVKIPRDFVVEQVTKTWITEPLLPKYLKWLGIL